MNYKYNFSRCTRDKRPIRTEQQTKVVIFTFSVEKNCLRESQPVFSENFSSVVGHRGGSSVAVSQGGGGGLDVVALGDDGGGLGPPHDGLSLHGNGHGDVVGSINMDGSGNLDDLLGVEGGVIGSVEWLVDVDWVLNLVDLLLHGHDGSIDSLGSLQDGWHSDGKMRSGGLQDPSGVPGDVAGLAEVDLLGHDGSWLVDGGHSLALGGGGVGSRGGGLGVGHGVVGNNGAGRVVLGSVGWHCSRPCSVDCSGHCSNHQLGGGGVGTSQDESKGHKRSHDARYLLLSC
jgi:hypothetical protein